MQRFGLRAVTRRYKHGGSSLEPLLDWRLPGVTAGDGTVCKPANLLPLCDTALDG